MPPSRRMISRPSSTRTTTSIDNALVAGATATIFFMHGKLYGRAVATVAWRRTRITPDPDALIKKSPTFRALEGRRGGGPEAVSGMQESCCSAEMEPSGDRDRGVGERFDHCKAGMGKLERLAGF